MIYWQTFSWEAFATIFTGAIAVAAATFVGRKQSEIARRQTEILGQQTDIEKLKIKVELFGKRAVVYNAVNDFLHEIVSRAAPASSDAERDFLVAKNTARFLFKQDVQTRLTAVYKDATSYAAAYKANKVIRDRGGAPGQDAIDREENLFAKLSETLTNLADLFGDELTLSH